MSVIPDLQVRNSWFPTKIANFFDKKKLWYSKAPFLGVWGSLKVPKNILLGTIVLRKKEYFFYERAPPGGGWSRCVSNLRNDQNRLQNSKNRDSGNDSLLHSGPLRLFLGESWVGLESLRCLGVKLRPFYGILKFGSLLSEIDSLVRSWGPD